MNIAILGGTGKEGAGLASRGAQAGHALIIGSRDAERARSKAAELRQIADWIDGGREYDRHGASRLQQQRHDPCAMGQDDVRGKRGQFRRVSANVGGTGSGPAGVDPQVAADGPVQLPHPL